MALSLLRAEVVSGRCGSSSSLPINSERRISSSNREPGCAGFFVRGQAIAARVLNDGNRSNVSCKDECPCFIEIKGVRTSPLKRAESEVRWEDQDKVATSFGQSAHLRFSRWMWTFCPLVS